MTNPEIPSTEDGLPNVFAHLPDALRARLAEQGIETPTAIQSATIPKALEGSDVLAQSATGSGKTLAFAIPLGVQLAQGTRSGVRALVLTPTRELAAQVTAVLEKTLSSLKLTTLAITGGSSYARQKRALASGVDIVVGTPGRICDLLAQESLSLSHATQFVLDEVDEMLDIGFAEDLKKIRGHLPAEVQTLFFSATLSSDIRKIAHALLRNPQEIRCEQAQGGKLPPTIEHSYLEVREGAEQKALVNALLFHNPSQALVFCKTRQECADLAEALVSRGFSAAALHGEMAQPERTATLDRFRDKRLQYLVATNVAARGIDVQDLALVVNFTVPFDPESYTHRVGRTGRNGASGKAWTIVTPRTTRSYEFLMGRLRLVPTQIEIPNSAEILKRSIASQVQALLEERPATNNRTAEKAVGRALESLDEESKTKILHELLLRKMEQMETYYADTIVTSRKLVRISDRPFERGSRPAAREGFRPGPRQEGKPFRKTSRGEGGAFTATRSSTGTTATAARNKFSHKKPKDRPWARKEKSRGPSHSG